MGAEIGRTFVEHKVVRGVDQRDMREGLREVAEKAARHGIVFLGEQPDIVGQRRKALEQLPASSRRPSSR